MHKNKKLKIIIAISLLIVAVMFFSSCQKHKTPVADLIEKRLDTVGAGYTAGIKLTEFTSFEWDKVLIFNYYTSQEEIYNALGVHFDGSTDLTNGMIFVKDGEIVHYEYFDCDYSFERPYRFIIYPQADVNGTPKYRVFTPNEADFWGEKTDYSNDYSYYRIYPLSYMTTEDLNK